MPSASATARPGHFALAALAAWVILFALYLLFAGSVSLDEAGTGAAAATLACIWWAFGGRRGGMRFAGWLYHLAPLGRAVAALPGATARVAGQLVHHIRYGRPPGRTVYERDSDSAWANADTPAEQALGLIAKSLAPDSYVLREKGGDTGIVEHRLSGGGEAR